MRTVADVRARLRRPLEQELRRGCRDDVVVGGVEALAEGAGAPFQAVREALRGYGDLEPPARRARVEEALARLEVGGEEEGDRAPPPAGTREPHAAGADGRPEAAAAAGPRPGAGAPPPGALPPGELLDAPLSERPVDLGAHAPKKLAEVGLRSHLDLLRHYPRRYEDRRALPSFEELAGRDTATAVGTVTGRKKNASRKGMSIVRVFLEDARGRKLTAVWFNQPWIESQVFPGQRIVVTGRPRRRGSRVELHATHLEVDDDRDTLSAGRIVGLYPSTRGLSQAYLRRAAWRLLEALGRVPDHLPRSVLEQYELVSLDRALRAVHFPADEEDLALALRRLRFDEFLFLELRVLLNRDPNRTGRSIEAAAEDVATFEGSLPFALTGAQKRALEEIAEDLRRPRQMARLLQGDVGSGKTAVAAAGVYLVARAGSQAALMAPTEILARQHFLNLRDLLLPLGVRCELIIGTMGRAERRAAAARVAGGEADLAVGTHALIQESVEFRDLGLAVVDEEHRFGVEQRRRLLRGLPDVLVMSATPIPRSLALTYYGDLDLTVIDELPPGRQPVETRLVDDRRRTETYRFVWERVREGRQAYVVAPLVEDSEAEAMEEIVSATQLVEALRAQLPDACRLDLLHGRMPGDEKDAVMERFRRGEVDVLVSTTVVEVGVDVPNATVMVIENAERFGLSQLHQLRGRVGRGAHASTCILVAGDRSRKTQKRLEVVVKHGDGFLIAEKDLELRGPGELRGTRQSGLPDLQLGDLSRDGEVVEEARGLAVKILEFDPRLEAEWAERLRAELVRRSGEVGFREIV